MRFGPYVRGKQLEVQMEVARQVQRDLLPPASAWPAGVDVAADCVPASEVGGDFYDIVNLRHDGIAFALGDVSGHGVSAALLMSLIHGAMSSPPWGTAENEPDRAAARLNHLLLTKTSGERFASLFWCSYDSNSGILRYVNAGHLPPLWIQRASSGAWTINRLTEAGPVLGVLGSAAYHTASVEAGEGDLLVLFSDGIVEAANSRDEEFGENRLIDAVKQHADERARAICDAILSAVADFTGERPAQDDRTLLVVRLWRRDMT
jgi:phosphoserine phosphatase RsbU/P